MNKVFYFRIQCLSDTEAKRFNSSAESFFTFSSKLVQRQNRISTSNVADRFYLFQNYRLGMVLSEHVFRRLQPLHHSLGDADSMKAEDVKRTEDTAIKKTRLKTKVKPTALR